jgi:hypothetical protein
MEAPSSVAKYNWFLIVNFESIKRLEGGLLEFYFLSFQLFIIILRLGSFLLFNKIIVFRLFFIYLKSKAFFRRIFADI